MTLRDIAKAMRDHVAGGGIIDQVVETRQDWSTWPYPYDFRLLLAGRRLYLETILQNDDPSDPIVQIVSIHDA